MTELTVDELVADSKELATQLEAFNAKWRPFRSNPPHPTTEQQALLAGIADRVDKAISELSR